MLYYIGPYYIKALILMKRPEGEPPPFCAYRKVKQTNSTVAPIFEPPMRAIAENEAEAGVRFRIVETGGIAVNPRLS